MEEMCPLWLFELTCLLTWFLIVGWKQQNVFKNWRAFLYLVWICFRNQAIYARVILIKNSKSDVRLRAWHICQEAYSRVLWAGPCFKGEEAEGESKNTAQPVRSAVGVWTQLCVSSIHRAVSTLHPFTAVPAVERWTKQKRAVAAGKLISSCLSHCCQTPEPRHGLAACSRPPLRGATSHTREWPGGAPWASASPATRQDVSGKKNLQLTAPPLGSPSASTE